MEQRLKKGNCIDVHGFIGLRGLNAGKRYMVLSMDSFSYTFKPIKGKTLVRHMSSSVDAAIKCFERGDLNGIQVL